MKSDSDEKFSAMAFGAISEDPNLVRTKLELSRIRSARSALLAAFLNEPHPNLAKSLRGIDRYERKAFARQRRLLRRLANAP